MIVTEVIVENYSRKPPEPPNRRKAMTAKAIGSPVRCLFGSLNGGCDVGNPEIVS